MSQFEVIEFSEDIIQHAYDMLGTFNPFDGGRLGICAHLGGFENQEALLRRIWAEWEYYSGDGMYPVPDPKVLNNDDNYAAYSLYCNKSDWTDEYRELRADLQAFLMEVFRELGAED